MCVHAGYDIADVCLSVLMTVSTNHRTKRLPTRSPRRSRGCCPGEVSAAQRWCTARLCAHMCALGVPRASCISMVQVGVFFSLQGLYVVQFISPCQALWDTHTLGIEPLWLPCLPTFPPSRIAYRYRLQYLSFLSVFVGWTSVSRRGKTYCTCRSMNRCPVSSVSSWLCPGTR